ncbi:MAG: vitamin B12 dependent methionine synthase [Anaerolineae bacterium]|nr:vitamin B12 dependent methionine synthase [Anaerolineae bacterium]
MNTLTLLQDIPFHIDLDVLRKRTRVQADSDHSRELERFAAHAQQIARPKAMVKVAFVEHREDDRVVIDSISFASRVLRVNLENVHRVFAYVATCGTELHEWGQSRQDLLERFWAEKIQEMALGQATQHLGDHITREYQPGSTATMNPGSLADWPLKEQRHLFALLDNRSDEIGVHLSDSFLMTPTKSVSGIRFPTEYDFESCQLCPRPDCPGRRAPYDQHLYDKKYKA